MEAAALILTLPEQGLQGLRKNRSPNRARVMGVTTATRIIESAQARGKGREPLVSERDGEAKSEGL